MPDPFLIEDGIREVLLGLSSVTALVGQRIRPGVLDEGDARPAVVISVEREEHQNTLDQSGGLVQADITVHAVADSHRQARILAKMIQTNGTNPATGLTDFSGPVSGGVIDSVEVIDEAIVPIPEGDDGDNWLFVVATTFQVWYGEPTR